MVAIVGNMSLNGRAGRRLCSEGNNFPCRIMRRPKGSQLASIYTFVFTPTNTPRKPWPWVRYSTFPTRKLLDSTLVSNTVGPPHRRGLNPRMIMISVVPPASKTSCAFGIGPGQGSYFGSSFPGPTTAVLSNPLEGEQRLEPLKSWSRRTREINGLLSSIVHYLPDLPSSTY